MMAKFKILQNCFLNFVNYLKGEIVLLDTEMGKKMNGIVEEVKEQNTEPETQQDTRVKPNKILKYKKTRGEK